MDKKSKMLFLVFFFILLGVIFLTYYRYMVVRDYVIEAQVSCDPTIEACFVYVCDPENGEECTGDPEQDTSYYKLLHRNARNIPLCDPQEADCPVAMCQPEEIDCRVTFCDSTAGEDAVCSDPETYRIEHSAAETMEDLGAPSESGVPSNGMEGEAVGGTGDEAVEIPSESGS
ncbi:MAG: hypothetical protein KBB51_03095 [Candidatus Moranbacteria bacterium]|jgi:hypothetical protein|nr:hypothetical protein [Candidatus Moranbacteria bacterium]